MTDGQTEKPSRAVALIELVEEICALHQDQHGTPFVWIRNPGQVVMLNTREFRSYATMEFYRKYGEVVSSEAMTAAVNVLSAEALQREKVPLEVRITVDHDGIIIDLCDDRTKEGVAAKVTKTGPDFVKVGHPLFRRYSHMKPFVLDFASGRGPEDVKNFLKKFKLKDPEQDVLLLTGFIGTAFIPDIPHPILILHGHQGSTKTTLTTAVAQLVDPSSLKVLSVSDRKDELAQQLAHRYAVAYDNVSRFQTWTVDTLCRASTGEAFTKRALYTDEDDVVFAFRRVVTMNGTNIPSKRGDFLDRALLIELSRVPQSERREDKAVWAEIEDRLPGLRAAVLDALSKAMSLVDHVREDLKELPRMADFCVWGEAFCRALSYEKGAFYKAYLDRIQETSKVALENDVVAELILRLFTEYKEYTKKGENGTLSWEGTAAELLKVLNEVNRLSGYVNEKEMPKSPETLGRWLNDLAANLSDQGVKVLRRRSDEKGTRKITLLKEPDRNNSKLLSEPSELSVGGDETKAKSTDSTTDSNKSASVSDLSVAVSDDETKASDSSDSSDGSLLSRRGLAPSTLDGGQDDPGSPEKGEPHPPPGLKPQHCPYLAICGYDGVFLYPDDLAEHLQKLHGGVKE
jgi:hypothetical protein